CRCVLSQVGRLEFDAWKHLHGGMFLRVEALAPVFLVELSDREKVAKFLLFLAAEVFFDQEAKGDLVAGEGRPFKAALVPRRIGIADGVTAGIVKQSALGWRVRNCVAASPADIARGGFDGLVIPLPSGLGGWRRVPRHAGEYRVSLMRVLSSAVFS